MKKILITGGAGFIGVNSAKHFVDRGWDVTLVDNLSRRCTEDNLQWLQAQSKVAFHRADIRDESAMRQIIGATRLDVMLHLAAQVATCVALNWTPKISVREGVKNLSHWVANHRDLFSWLR